MELNNTFDVPAPRSEAWSALVDVDRVATCLPGASLISSSGDEHEGLMKVKVGPIRMQYKGIVRFMEKDESAGRIVLRGEGRDSRGQGAASAVITLTLSGDDASTHVSVSTELQITGKVAQFGRNVLSDVSDNLIGQFAGNLEQEILGTRLVDAPTHAGSGSEASRVAAPRQSAERPVDQVARGTNADYADLSQAAGNILMTRLPMLAVVAAVGLISWALGRRGRCSGGR